MKLPDAGVAISHHASLAKRAGKMGVAIDIQKTEGPLDVVVDSTGLKVYGEGERKVRIHGVGKRRTWRKVLHQIAMSRMKIAFGDLLKNRKPPGQRTEAARRCMLLNWFVFLGMPLAMWS